MTNLDSILKSRDITLPTKISLVKAMVFPVVIYQCESWTIKKAEHRRIDTFELWCWRRLLSVPWTARRLNKSILMEINPEYSLEGLMLKLKLQCFGHLMWKADSLEKTLILGKIEGRKKRGQQRMRWLDGIMTQWTWVWANSRRNGEGQGSLACHSACGHKESDMTEWLNNDNNCLVDIPPTLAASQPLQILHGYNWSRKWQSTPVFSCRKFHKQRSLASYSPWGCRIRHNWATEYAHTHAQPYLSPIPPESQLPSVLSYRSQGKCHYLGYSGLKLKASLNCSFCLSPHIWLDLTMLNSHHLSSLESVFPFHTDGHHQSTGSYCFLPQLLKLYLDLLAIKMHPTRQVSHPLLCDLPINTCWDIKGP